MLCLSSHKALLFPKPCQACQDRLLSYDRDAKRRTKVRAAPVVVSIFGIFEFHGSSWLIFMSENSGYYGKSRSLRGKSTIDVPFLLVMLNSQRVSPPSFWGKSTLILTIRYGRYGLRPSTVWGVQMISSWDTSTVGWFFCLPIYNWEEAILQHSCKRYQKHPNKTTQWFYTILRSWIMWWKKISSNVLCKPMLNQRASQTATAYIGHTIVALSEWIVFPFS